MNVRNFASFLVLSATLMAQPQSDEFFEKKIRPLFAKSCAGCHNAKMKAGGFDLTSPEGIAAGGLFEKGKPEASLLVKALSYDERIKMPPNGKLPAAELQDVKTWILAGAPMPEAKPGANTVTSSGTRKHGRGITDEEKAFWAFRPMGKPEPPAVKNAAWARTGVDRFLLAKLEQKGLQPAKTADKATILRRATFNLTGLPPTEQELKDFLADSSPNALEKVVDRLLASPRYGEHWGRHWLDVARYADSTGNDEDHRYPYAYRYRDYVIESMNQDVPFDRFLQEQIAGDLMPAPEGQKLNTRGIVATGFLALGAKAVAQQDKKKMLVDIYDEQIDTVSKGVLGMTLACARCHDHKFDPLQTRDYYSWMTIFASTKNFNNPDTHVSGLLYTPLVPKEEYDVYLESKKVSDKKRAEIANAVELQTIAYTAEVGQSVAKYMLAARSVMAGKHVTDPAVRRPLLDRWVAFLTEGQQRRAYLKDWYTATDATAPAIAAKYQARYVKMQASWAEAMERTRASRRSGKDVMPPRIYADDDQFFFDVHYEGPHGVPAKERAKLWPADKIAPVAKLEREFEDLKKQLPQEPPMACAVADHPAGEGGVTFGKVYVRGDYNTFGEDAPKGVPQVLSDIPPPAFPAGSSGRLELAQWLTRPDNPLTARVFVNRVWYWHFGEGIVRTPDNFGKMGARPSHPELLDYLAQKFVSEGWSIKKLQKEIMLSSAYQMSSLAEEQAIAADPDNVLLSRYPRRRLTVEELRDGMLWLDRSLDTTMGGSLQSGFGTDGENSSDRLSMKPEAIKRRTVYVPLRRANLPGLLNLFDFGDATTTASQRTSTIIAPQALFLMNSEFVEDRAKALAKQTAEAGSDAERMRRLYFRVLGREATGTEVDDSLSYLRRFREHFPKRTSDDAWMSMSRILLASNEYIYLD